jgi:hypothetical protein
MDILYFLKERTRFIRSFYENASRPFRETMRKIEAHEEPFKPLYASEDSEPPFLQEWLEADEALEVLGRNCVSMLSESLKLYLTTWEAQFWRDRPCAKCLGKIFRESGFLHGYRTCFGEVFKINWDECPADFSILEQITLARNADQHPENIATVRVSHNEQVRRKHARLFFIRESERDSESDPNDAISPWFDPTLHVSRETLFEAIVQVEKLADWLEVRMLDARYPGRVASGNEAPSS